MAPHITSWKDLGHVSEDIDPETGEFLCTSFAVAADDIVYTGQLNTRKTDITLQQITAALNPIPDEVIFPKYPTSPDAPLTRAPEILPDNVYIKRPALSTYNIYKKYNGLNTLRKCLLQEAQAMQVFSKHPHPHIIRYHGCVVKRGYITGLVLDRHASDLEAYLENDRGRINKESFMAALESAIYHLHSLGWAHNDLDPSNILVDASGMPVLINFEYCREIGRELPTLGAMGWRDMNVEEYTKSDTKHDLLVLDKLREWFDNTTLQN